MDVLDVAHAHDVTIARRKGAWEVIESFAVNEEGPTLTVRERLAPSPPKPRTGEKAGGAGSRNKGDTALSSRHTTARFRYERQFFLDNLIARFAQIGSSSDPCLHATNAATRSSFLWKARRPIPPFIKALGLTQVDLWVGTNGTLT